MDLKKLESALVKLKAVDLTMENADDLIHDIIKQDIVKFAFPNRILEPGFIFFRSRNNYSIPEFTTINDLSYRKDIANIKEYGRANKPNQAIFYCADSKITAIGETSSAARCEKYKTINEFSITTGVWETIDYLKLALIVNNQDAQKKNEIIKGFGEEVEKITKNIFVGEANLIQTFLNFLSNEFAVYTNCNHLLYKICCAFSYYIYKNSDGFIYPSVQREFDGFNIALKPEVVEKLKLVEATKDTFRKTDEMTYEQIDIKKTTRIENEKLIWK